MSISSRFAVAVHILALLESAGGEPVTSERIAGSANTNAAVIRRILCMLAAGGLTRSQLGAGGGALLARPAGEITLLDVYRAVEEGELFAMHHSPPSPRCDVGRNIRTALEETTEAARTAMEGVLSRQTVADVLAEVRGCAGGEARATESGKNSTTASGGIAR